MQTKKIQNFIFLPTVHYIFSSTVHFICLPIVSRFPFIFLHRDTVHLNLNNSKTQNISFFSSAESDRQKKDQLQAAKGEAHCPVHF